MTVFWVHKTLMLTSLWNGNLENLNKLNKTLEKIH